MNSLAPVLNWIEDVFGIKNDPETSPPASVNKSEEPSGWVVALFCVLPNSVLPAFTFWNAVDLHQSETFTSSKYGIIFVFGLKPAALKKTLLDLINGAIAMSRTLSSTNVRIVLLATTLETASPVSKSTPFQFHSIASANSSWLVGILVPPSMTRVPTVTSLHSSEDGEMMSWPLNWKAA